MAPSQEYLNNYAGAPQNYSAQIVDAQGNPIKHHVHHTYIWLASLRTAVIILFVFFASIAGAFIDDELSFTDSSYFLIFLIPIIIYIVILICVFLYQVISYKHLYFTIDSKEFCLYSGVLNKKRVHIPYMRIQSVDQKASLVQRIFGVCSVQIDTAGGADNKAVVVPYVTKAQAVWLRSQLFLRKEAAIKGSNIDASPVTSNYAEVSSPAPGVETDNVLEVVTQAWDEFGSGIFSSAASDDGTVTYQYGLSNKELLFTGLSNSTGVVAAFIAVLVAISQFIEPFLQLFPGMGDIAVEGIVNGYKTFAVEGIIFAIISVVAFIFVIWVFSIIGALISYGGFRARRRGTRIEVERGLLQHVYTGVDIDRVQAVVVKQTLIRRLLGYCELSLSKIDAAGADTSGNNQNQALNDRGLVIHPFLKLSRVQEVLAQMVPEYAGVPEDIVPVAKVALRRAVIRQCIWQGGGFWFAVSVAVAQMIVNVVFASELGDYVDLVNSLFTACYVIAGIICVLAAINAVLWARGSGFACNRDFIRIVNSGLGCTSTDIMRRKIQHIHTRSNPFQRMAGTSTICVRSAAGIGGTTVSLIDVRAQDADECLEWLKPRH